MDSRPNALLVYGTLRQSYQCNASSELSCARHLITKKNIANLYEAANARRDARQLFLACEHMYSKVFGAQHQDSVEAGWREGAVCDCSCDSHKKTRDRKRLVLFVIRHEKIGTYPGRDKASARGKHIKRRQECLLRETRKNIMKKEKLKRQLLGLLLVLLFKEQLQSNLRNRQGPS
jgi:hypothetical protein